MNTVPEILSEIEDERLRKIKELVSEFGPNWTDGFEPGSLGRHELLDRTNLVANNLEEYVLEHPACIQNPEWYTLAEQAVTALRELYQRVGAEH